LFGLGLLLPRLAERASRPLVAVGERLASGQARSRFAPVALGLGTGLLWVPCAGPILGVVLASAALNGPGVGTSILLLAYAAGTAATLGLVGWFGLRAGLVLRPLLPPADRLRRLAGAGVLAAVAVPALGLDATVLARIPSAATTATEQRLLDKLRPVSGERAAEAGPLAALSGATGWIASPALSAESLRGKVVLVNFWTYSCINCLRSLPYLRAWSEKYRDAGLVVIGVHTPEFAFEKSPANVRRAMADLGITYPVATDNGFAVWRGLRNQSWPAFHFFDAEGRLRHHVAGEHDYERSEQMLRTLLAEAGQATASTAPVRPEARGTQAAPDLASLRSGETYVGYERATGFSGTRIQQDHDALYTPAMQLRTGRWTLGGQWRVEGERAVLTGPQGRIVHRFHARDLHMVLGPAPDGKPVRFRVLLDGRPAGADHGTDTDANGHGVVDRQKLYQLVRQRTPGEPRLFEIEFLDPGAEAYAFTFG
ncbi:MAG TPA: redoxin family protein, partial [Ramlibacter sp.]|nr:redoxin family protein [Ramlibacter sp.]